MDLFRWLMNVWSFEFGGWDYRKNQCDAILNGGACVRCRLHPGQHRDNLGQKW